MLRTTKAASRRRRLLTLLAAVSLSAGTAAACENCGSACPSCQGVYSQSNSVGCDCLSCCRGQSSSEPRRGVMLGLGSKLLDSVDRSADAFEQSVHSLLDLRPKLKRRSRSHHRAEPCDLPSYSAILEMPPAGEMIDEPFEHDFHCVDELGAEGLSGEVFESETIILGTPEYEVGEHGAVEAEDIGAGGIVEVPESLAPWQSETPAVEPEVLEPRTIEPELIEPVRPEVPEAGAQPPAGEDDPFGDEPIRTGTAPVSTRVRAAGPILNVPVVQPQTDYFHDPFRDEAIRPVDKSVPASNRYKSATAQPASTAPLAAKPRADQGSPMQLGGPRPATRELRVPVSNPVYSRAYDPQAYIEEQRRYDQVHDAISKTLARKRTLANVKVQVADAAPPQPAAEGGAVQADYIGAPVQQDPLVRPAAALQLSQ